MILKHDLKHQALLLKRACSFSLVAVALVALGACAGGKKVTTVDNSADYSSAVSLPPLKKPSQESPVVAPSEGASIPVSNTGETATARREPETIAAVDLPPAEVSVPANNKAVEPIAAPNVDNLGAISARVISPNPSAARLLIENEFEASWSYLSDNLKQSDVTVFSRNKAAGRFSIGCANIDDAPVVEKKGGWTFRSKRKERLEYCALQAVSTRGSTLVTVLNRAGEEVSGDYAAKVFERILNN